MSKLVVATAILVFSIPAALRADVLSNGPTAPERSGLFGSGTHGGPAFPRNAASHPTRWLVADATSAGGAPAVAHESASGSNAMHFPDNETTTLPVIVTKGGDEAFKKDVAALQQTLTELQQLSLQLKQAHWNVSGTLYYPLHLLLQEHYEGVSKLADTIAERLLSIGSSSDGRATTIVKTSKLPEIPGGFLDDAQVLTWFTMAYKTVGEEVKTAISQTNDIDPSTSNLLQEVEHVIAKYQWQFRAEFQKTSTDPNNGSNLNNGRPVQLPSSRSAPEQNR